MTTEAEVRPASSKPQWHDAMESATIENVSNLKQVNHGWIVTVVPTAAATSTATTNNRGVLAILDITNRVRGEGTEPRYLNVGPCPDPDKEGVEICKALLSTMMAPSNRNKDGSDAEYYEPRRPAWILLEKELLPCLELVTSILATVEVTVKLNTPEALAGNSVTNFFSEKKATWDAGMAMGATEENVKELERRKDDVWRCSMTMIHDNESGAKECFLAVEDITDGTDDEKSYPLGVGPCPAATVNPDGMVRALFATMLSPRAKEGGKSGDSRRPGRLVLDKSLEPWLEHVQSKISSLDITVEVMA